MFICRLLHTLLINIPEMTELRNPDVNIKYKSKFKIYWEGEYL